MVSSPEMLEEACTCICLFPRLPAHIAGSAWCDSGPGGGTAWLKVSSSFESHAVQACVQGQAPGAALPPYLGLML